LLCEIRLIESCTCRPAVVNERLPVFIILARAATRRIQHLLTAQVLLRRVHALLHHREQHGHGRRAPQKEPIINHVKNSIPCLKTTTHHELNHRQKVQKLPIILKLFEFFWGKIYF
jgi:hypothetical protein